MFTRKQLVRLIVPLIVEQLLAATIGMADTLMVSGCGEAAVSGVSLVDSINLLLISIFAALATGGAIVSAQYLGREDHPNANVAAKQLLLVTTGLSMVIMAVCLIWRTSIIHGLFGAAEPLVLENALIYFLLSALSYPFIAIYNACAALFRAMGNSKISMFASILMNAVNIGGNAIFIFGFNMGAAGAALASLLSRILGAVIMLVFLRNPHNFIRLDNIFKLGFHPAMIKNILQIGVPTGLENGMFNIGKILVQGLIASFGTVAITANAVANGVAALAQIPGSAIGLAMVTVVGQCVGAQEYGQAKKYVLKLGGAAYVLITVTNLLVLLGLSPIIGWYSVSPQTAEIAKQLIVYHGVCSMLIWTPSFALPNGLRAANDVRFTMITSVFSMWVFRIGFSYIIAQWMGWGVLGVWVAMSIDWLFRAIVFVTRFLSGKWQNKRLI
ncbi:MATE family efflux transporter [Hydrogenoanaerobacterium sp.]|uniref:MATE family efflux transporter n=1 Tax=Hydrogenoanaerobacterium sp. TaxID=2953763 RepID=UPI0028983084|nr:MATE family efflux transporter [Hydrogenoanaerobacterium sp.]